MEQLFLFSNGFHLKSLYDCFGLIIASQKAPELGKGRFTEYLNTLIFCLLQKLERLVGTP